MLLPSLNLLDDFLKILAQFILGDMEKAKISVVMPAYNAEKYIVESIDSVLNQENIDYFLEMEFLK